MEAQVETQPDFEKTYHALISKYIELLRYSASDRVSLPVRALIEDHIRVNLQEIAEGLTLLDYDLSDEASGNDLTWTRKQAEYLTRLADQLANIREPILKYLWRGVIVLFTAAVLQFAGPDQSGNAAFILANIPGIFRTLLITFGVLLLLVIQILSLLGTVAINLKRSFFLPGFDVYGRRSGPVSQEAEGVNVYRLENALFELLGRKKPKEPAWDVWGLTLLSVILVALIAGLILHYRSAWPNPYVGWLIILGVGILLFLFIRPGIRNRLKRDR